jgi:hypothetical protein
MRSMRRPAFLVLLALLTLPTLALAQSADGWNWDIALYLWGSDISIDAGDQSTNVDFRDLVSKLDIGGAFHIEGHGPRRGGFFVDITYLELADDQVVDDNPVLPPGTVIEVENTTFMGEVGGIYSFGDEDSIFDLLFGARFTDLGLDVVVIPPDFPPLPQEVPEPSVTDGFLGFRVGSPLGSSRWAYRFRGDIGAGDSDFVWNAILNFNVTVGKKGNKALIFAYRHLEGDVEDGPEKVEYTFSGPMIAFNWRL